MRESYTEKISPVVAERWEEERGRRQECTKEPKAGFRAQVARDVFAELSSQEQKEIGARAKAEATEAKATYLKMLNDGPSQTPEDRQKCITALPDFVAPFLQGLHEYTSLHATLIMGGPIPKFGGELRTVHVAYGRNNTAAAPHWAEWDKPRFATQVQNFMVEYLKTAYSPEACASAALSSTTTDLNAVKYTIDRDEEDSQSDSDSDLDSDSDSSMGSESDEEDTRARKKQKNSTKGRKASAKSNNGQEEPANDDADFDDVEEDALPAKDPLPPWHISHKEREANIRRNNAMLENLKAEWAAALPDQLKAKPKLTRQRASKTAPVGPPRRSTRHAANVGDGEEAPPVVVTPLSAPSVPTSSTPPVVATPPSAPSAPTSSVAPVVVARRQIPPR
ncbi:hypothetical protein B0H13DRAFT_1922609 [Mycena leptocephala]|nr:hypothetical protein B0H13DRAFT_1922609 [Mycena leptocephala]